MKRRFAKSTKVFVRIQVKSKTNEDELCKEHEGVCEENRAVK
jgi:hypothetical protein